MNADWSRATPSGIMGNWSIYGHGSGAVAAKDASDVDVMIVTTDPVDRETAGRALVTSQLATGGLPLDPMVAHPDWLSVMEWAVLAEGTHLAGPVLDVKPPDATEWAHRQQESRTTG